jgi:hypothetical protein
MAGTGKLPWLEPGFDGKIFRSEVALSRSRLIRSRLHAQMVRPRALPHCGAGEGKDVITQEV